MSRVEVNGLGLGKSNEWATPKVVFDALGVRFDLDVAAPPDGPLFTPCDQWISSHSLEAHWHGFVWMNPPFGGRNGIGPWLEKFLSHGNGIALTPDRASAPWFQDGWERADAILFARGRPPFLRHDGKRAGAPAFGMALWATGDRAVAALEEAQTKGFGFIAQRRGQSEARRQGQLFGAAA